MLTNTQEPESERQGLMISKRCVLAGGSGFLGRALAAELVRQGYQVMVLTRSPGNDARGVQYVEWDGRTPGRWADTLAGAQAVINLTGKSVNCRYNPENRREILSSRVDSVNVIGEVIRHCAQPPEVWVQCASSAIYGDAGETICDENATVGEGFSPATCQVWEQTFDSQPAPGTRKVLLRIGFVLGRGEGALGTLSKLARCYLGGTVGSGRQYISWLHLNDLSRVFLHAIEHRDMEGLFNVCSPHPVTNRQFMHELRLALRRPWSPPVPPWAVRFGCRLMSTEPELALHGRRCPAQRLQENGFTFSYPYLREALYDLLA